MNFRNRGYVVDVPWVEKSRVNNFIYVCQLCFSIVVLSAAKGFFDEELKLHSSMGIRIDI